MTKRLKVVALSLTLLFSSTATAYAAENEPAEVSISVVVNIDGVPRLVASESESVGELLDTISYLDPSSYVLEGSSRNDKLEDGKVINLISVTETEVAETEEIAFETVKKENNTLASGTENVIQDGENGVLTKTYKEIYSGDKLLSRELVKEAVTTKPVDRIVDVGTYVEPVAVQTAASSAAPGSISGIDYKYALNVTATGYTPYDPGCTGITASGTVAKRGSIAVDPRVIPMGTKLYIPGYGYGVAEDTGGAIKGNKIDLCYSSKNEAFSWGRRNVTIYVLD